MPRIFGSQFGTDTENTRNNRGVIKTEDLQTFEIRDPPVLDYSANVLIGKGRLRKFTCDVILDTGIARTRFFDTSGSPDGTEPLLFGFLSEAQGNDKRNNHNFDFPGEGLHFQNGVGVLCEVVDGTPTIDGVEAVGYYHNTPS